tara:strand:+ start:24607 stop:25062 length:456 start_codon:yes stop_codon:yes gene_type:complete
LKTNRNIYCIKIILIFLSTFFINISHSAEIPKELIIEDIDVGDGRMVMHGKEVAVHYTGWLFNKNSNSTNSCDSKGKQFDSSIERGMPFQVILGQGRVIQGWEEGLIGMKENGKRCLVIPPSMGYGNRAVGGGLIPANSTLIFEVILLGVR